MRVGAGRTRPGRLLAAALLCTVAAVIAPSAAGADEVDEFRDTWEYRALELQYELGSDVPFVDAPFLGTHNSFNSPAELGPGLPAEDSNQRIRLVDQLEIGVRALELDLHRAVTFGPSGPTFRPVVCHILPGASGCSAAKELEPILEEISRWARRPQNSEQVLLLYLEDDLSTEETHDDAAATIEEELGDLVYRPVGGGDECVELPVRELSRADVRDAGKQVVIVSGCGAGTAWRSLAHAWSDRRESRPFGFEDFPDCGPDHSRAEYERRQIRYYEDSTRVDPETERVDDGLTPETTAAMARCGVDLIAFDQLEPFDERLGASVWSWSAGQPSVGACALIRRGGDRLSRGRWSSRRCSELRHSPACLTRDGENWIVPRRRVVVGNAARSCRRRKARWAVPRTGYENQLLRLAMGDRGIGAAMLGYRRSDEGWLPLDRR